MKINLGCGNDYREEWVNVDFNKEIKADEYIDLELPLPYEDNSVDEVLLDNTLEHIKNIFPFLDELHRICKQNAIIEIYVPHFSGIYATKHLAHYYQFGIGSFDIFKEVSGLDKGFNGERYGKARFEVVEQKLRWFHHKSAEHKSKEGFSWFFNINRVWQLILEKFSCFKFDEIYFKLKVVKKLSKEVMGE